MQCVLTYQVHQFDAMTYFLVSDTDPLGNGQVRACGEVHRLQGFPVPIKVGRIQQIGAQVQHVTKGKQFARLLQYLFPRIENRLVSGEFLFFTTSHSYQIP